MTSIIWNFGTRILDADMRIPNGISRILSRPSIIAFQLKFCQKKTYQRRFSNRLQNKAYTIDITSRGRNPKSISHDGNSHIVSARVTFRSLHTKTFDKPSSTDRAVSVFAYGTNQGEP